MLAAFTAGLLLITVSELGDKTFFIAVILATRHSRRLVFIGVIAALAAMTILSVLMGKVASLLPAEYIHHAEVGLFLGFGVKLLYDAAKMPAKSEGNEAEEAAEVVEQASLNLPASGKTMGFVSALGLQSSQMAVMLQAFTLTFLAEWGDRTQIATITLAAANNPAGVALGAVLGHSICAALAVIGGKLIANRISERMMTTLGGCLFLIFGIVAAFEGVPKSPHSL
ncbi:MAG: TMEM165/GDT1 family protein [Oscillatoriaceae bacterium SKW80]|nr:TMEM165/GDT1 family protein [Oscillatoriaceae bacterium SKYG93]MCX8119577.1 TMEM165/GDT1 family protein [Oscillatoriaceae bacterium SKW80]MDW8455044.1 TMEM165/GDT1 family protein [Oscillatoriaceae cyanobacterium SKYGB_i_bin93]HIK28179.1 TMEM165/GDT1 family protein [Oscillatoriaceae cyanobacterium M7585_C2015_266]